MTKGRFADEFKDQKCLWPMLNINTHVIAYNTEMVPREARPKSLQDLLHPRWKGKLVMDTTDDEQVVRYSLRSILEEEGYKVLEASDGDEGIKKI